MSGTGARSPRAVVPRVRAPRALVLPAALVCALAMAPSAHAIYGPAAGGYGADIVSVDNASDEQGNAPTIDAVISASGRYVVFQTRATNFFEDDGGAIGPHGTEPDVEPAGTLREGGIFRYDRDTGAIQLVADGSEVYAEGPRKGGLVFAGAENPSVSADGRYVAFSTAQQLVPQDENENVDVYVRDMDVPLGVDRKDTGAYELVSATTGGERAASYAPHSPALPGDEPGAEAWPNTAIGADGRYVVFRTTAVESNLPGGGPPSTPGEQLFIRDLRQQTTTLISRNSTSGEAAGGAIGPASISGDGSTVSWVSTNAPEQTRFLPGEPENNSEPFYLWRRWQQPGAPTRRVTGIADPDDPQCREGEGITLSQTAQGPCYGPLSEPESSLASIALTPPGLSEDGYTVAFLAGAALRPNITKSSGLDVFLTSMAPHVSRKAGTRELTLGVQSGNIGSTPSIESLALSADGSTIAFTTLRDDFVLPEPRLVGGFSPFPRTSELYVVHVAEDTLERAVLGYGGGEPEGSTLVGPSLTADGSTVTFASAAPNLIFGDANQVSDAFTATFEPPAGTAAPPAEVNSTLGGFSISSATEAPELGLHVKRGKAGELLLLVETPGAGYLSVKAVGRITVKVGRHNRKKRVVLAQAHASARSEGTTTIALRVASKYVKNLEQTGKLAGELTVAFEPPAPAEALSAQAGANFVGRVVKEHGPAKRGRR